MRAVRLGPTRLAQRIWPAVAVVATVVVYASITRAYFAGDDFCHFFDALNLPMREFVLLPWGGHVLITSNAVTWPMFRAFGLHPWLYLSVMLALHALNVLLLYWLVLRWTGRTTVAGVAAALWGTSPLHVVTLGWFAIFGEVILATLALVLLLTLDLARERSEARPLNIGVWIVLALMASTSFGMGLAVGLALPLLVWLLGPVAGLRRGARVAVWAVPLVTVALYLAVRAFDPQESKGQVDELVSVHAALGAWRYGVSMILLMVPYAFSVLSFGFLGAPRTDPATWRLVIGAACVAAVLAAGLRMRALDRRRVLAAAALAMLAYGVVVAGRAPVFQQMAFTPGQAATIPLHYHTFPSIGLVLCLCLAWCALTASKTVWAASAQATACVWLIAWAVGVFVNRPIFAVNDRVRMDVAAALQDIDSRVEAAPPQSVVVIPNRRLVLGRGVPCNMWGIAGLFLMASRGRDTVDGRTVRFAVPKHEWQAARDRGGRLAQLLVPDVP
jgi:hypothetical protein